MRQRVPAAPPVREGARTVGRVLLGSTGARSARGAALAHRTGPRAGPRARWLARLAPPSRRRSASPAASRPGCLRGGADSCRSRSRPSTTMTLTGTGGDLIEEPADRPQLRLAALDPRLMRRRATSSHPQGCRAPGPVELTWVAIRSDPAYGDRASAQNEWQVRVMRGVATGSQTRRPSERASRSNETLSSTGGVPK